MDSLSTVHHQPILYFTNGLFRCNKGCKSHNLLICTLVCGEGGIRTPGPVKINGFQDRRNRPLCHLSFIKGGLIKSPFGLRFCKGRNYFAFLQIFLQ